MDSGGLKEQEKQHNEELHNLSTYPNIAARMREKCVQSFWQENLMARDR
jgi:hypothetical protein